MEIVTGYTGTDHVESWQDRDLNQGIFGSGTYVFNVGSKLAATITSNNEVTISDGALSMQGCIGVIQKGTSQSLAIASGSQGMNRKDLICVQYSKSGAVESLDLVVIQGTPTSGDATAPSYTSADIQSGVALAQHPLYEVNINGLTIQTVTLSSLTSILDTRANTGLSNILVSEVVYTPQVSIEIGSTYTTTLTVSKNGYSLIGVIGCKFTDMVGTTVQCWQVDDTTIQWLAENHESGYGSFTGRLYATLLWKKEP